MSTSTWSGAAGHAVKGTPVLKMPVSAPRAGMGAVCNKPATGLDQLEPSEISTKGATSTGIDPKARQ